MFTLSFDSFISNLKYVLFSLGQADVDGSLQFLFAVVVIVHEFGVPQDKPAHFPVSAGQRGQTSALLIEPARLQRLLLRAKPHEGVVLQNAPTSAPRDHQTSCTPEEEPSQHCMDSVRLYRDQVCFLTFHVEVTVEIRRSVPVQDVDFTIRHFFICVHTSVMIFITIGVLTHTHTQRTKMTTLHSCFIEQISKNS